MIHAVVVYCGSHTQADARYTKAAENLARCLAERHIDLVYGGANVGTMKTLADTALACGGKVHGVFTKNLRDEIKHPGLTDCVTTETLAERKAKMLELADAAIALPGGPGTWDEFFDALVMRLMRNGHNKPLGLLNVDGYYEPLLTFIRHSVEVGFCRPAVLDWISVAPTAEELLKAICGGR